MQFPDFSGSIKTLLYLIYSNRSSSSIRLRKIWTPTATTLLISSQIGFRS